MLRLCLEHMTVILDDQDLNTGEPCNTFGDLSDLVTELWNDGKIEDAVREWLLVDIAAAHDRAIKTSDIDKLVRTHRAVRFTQAEWDKADRQATAAGYPNRSSFIRAMALGDKLTGPRREVARLVLNSKTFMRGVTRSVHHLTREVDVLDVLDNIKALQESLGQLDGVCRELLVEVQAKDERIRLENE